MRIALAVIVLGLVGCPAPKKKSPKPAPPAAVETTAVEEVAPVVEPEACAKPSKAEAAEVSPAQDPLAELSALGDEVVAGGPDAGGSIRAKRDPPVDAVRANPCRLRAKVEDVIRGRFPLAAVRVRILEPPKEGAGTELKKNDVVVVLPRVVAERGRVKMEDGATARNASAFYLSKGDRVHLLLESKRADGVWWAEAIARD
jgi:hypothetical protein